MDAFALIMLTVPIFFPVSQALNKDLYSPEDFCLLSLSKSTFFESVDNSLVNHVPHIGSVVISFCLFQVTCLVETAFSGQASMQSQHPMHMS